MPKPADYLYVSLITFYFIALCSKIKITKSMASIKSEWPKYRCNPLFMLMADDIETNFISCTQTQMKNFSQPFLNPLHTLISKLTDIAGGHSDNLNSMRISQSNVRSLMGNNFSAMISVFEMIGVEFLKNVLVTQDILGKVVGIIMSIMYIMESTIFTFQSGYDGPPGQTLQSVANFALCFHPNTVLELRNGEKIFIKNLRRNMVLNDGSRIEKVLCFYNILKEPFVVLNGILVTGKHKVWDATKDEFVDAEMHPDAIAFCNNDKEFFSEWLISIITDTGTFQIDDNVFLDWNG